MIKSTVVLTTLFLAMTGISADKLGGDRGLKGKHHKSSKGSKGPKGWEGPKDEFGGPCSKFNETLLEDLSCPTDIAMSPTAPCATASLAPGSVVPCLTASRENPTRSPPAATPRVRYPWMIVVAAREHVP